MHKDLFSKQSDLYAKYRPSYPAALYDHILSFVQEKNIAWDCATGNGQAANVLADHFQKVIASDISQSQIDKATKKDNIEYVVCAAESTPFTENTFDLVTVAQAYHWFDWNEFKKETTRVCKQGAIIAVWMYGGHRTDDEKINTLAKTFYEQTTHAYWEPERNHVESNYETTRFEYELLPTKDFRIETEWYRQEWLGYISTWSAVQKYVKQNGESPLPKLEEASRNLWPDHQKKKIHFPVYLKLGRIPK